MQTFVLPLFAIFSGILAQDINSLPDCERNCVQNVVGLGTGPPYNCPGTGTTNVAGPSCLCSREEFAHAIQDCSTQSCPPGTNITAVSDYGLQYCQTAQNQSAPLAAIGIFASGAGLPPITTVPLVSTVTSDSSTLTTTTGSSTLYSGQPPPITTVPLVSTVTSDSSTLTTTTGSSTIYSGQPIPNSTEMSSSMSSTSTSAITTRAILSTVISGTTTRETTVGSTTEFSTQSSQAGGATMAPLRVGPSFMGRQKGRGLQMNMGSWMIQALGWTVAVVGLAQLAL